MLYQVKDSSIAWSLLLGIQRLYRTFGVGGFSRRRSDELAAREALSIRARPMLTSTVPNILANSRHTIDDRPPILGTIFHKMYRLRNLGDPYARGLCYTPLHDRTNFL
jgi:hypothetical protein